MGIRRPRDVRNTRAALRIALFAAVLPACRPGGDVPAPLPTPSPASADVDATIRRLELLVEAAATRAAGLARRPDGTLRSVAATHAGAPAGDGDRLERVGDWLRATTADEPGWRAVPRADALVAADDAGAFRLRDDRSGLSVDVALEGGRAVTAGVHGGIAAYPRGYPGADVLVRAVAGGVEDFVVFDARPDAPEVAYEVVLGEGIAGLRQVANVLEFLDGTGAPRLRVAPPYLLDLRGVRHPAAVAVRGCAVDTSPAPPWDRPVTPPGARRCRLVVSWDGGAPAYPAVLDPAWTATRDMSSPRTYHAAVVLANGRVLVIAGHNGGAWINSSEVYDPATDTWAASGNLAVSRAGHRAVVLPSGRVLATGGYNGSFIGAAEMYDPSTGFWTGAGSTDPRSVHAFVGLPNGKALAAGGVVVGAALRTCELYNPTTGLWNATNPMLEMRGATRAVVLPNGWVLVAGGWSSNGSGSLQSAELYDATSAAWTPAGTMASRHGGNLSATPLASGKVLVAGGDDAGASADLYDPANATWTGTGPLTAGRIGHSASLLVDGRVLAAGGYNSGGTLFTAELFDPSSATWSATARMGTPRRYHTSASLASGRVLVAGGRDDVTIWRTAELYSLGPGVGPGVPCAAAADCASGFCVDGVCCTSACAGGDSDCQACSGAAGAATDGTCGPVSAGHLCRAAIDVCDETDRCDGTARSCPVDRMAPPTAVCRAAVGVCDAQEQCTGFSSACPADALLPPVVVCRKAAGPCDADERCPGNSAACPADELLGAAVRCRAAAGPCDVAERCSGADAECPADTFAATTTVCRLAIDACDAEERCDGASSACPGDALQIEGFACDDGDKCTRTDGCRSGLCWGGNPVVCTAEDACHDVGTCNPATGTCSNPARPDGIACSDGNSCTTVDTCVKGTCTGSSPVACAPANECRLEGTCDPSSGTCSSPSKPDGTGCSRGSCVAGSCQGADAGTSQYVARGCGCGPGGGGPAGAVAVLAVAVVTRRRRAGGDSPR